MRAACVIILTSSKADALRLQIDDIIQKIVDEKRVPILVLGPDADALLPFASKIDQCEIVFDPNFSGGEFSGVKAGLHATAQPAFIWNGNGSFPDAETRFRLEKALPDVKDDVLQLSNNTSQVLITRNGLIRLRSLNSNTQWRTSPLVQFSSLSGSDSDAPGFTP